MPLGVEVGLSPGNIVLGGNPARPPPNGKGHSRLPAATFQPMSVVAKGLPISATAELLSMVTSEA